MCASYTKGDLLRANNALPLVFILYDKCTSIKTVSHVQFLTFTIIDYYKLNWLCQVVFKFHSEPYIYSGCVFDVHISPSEGQYMH